MPVLSLAMSPCAHTTARRGVSRQHLRADQDFLWKGKAFLVSIFLLLRYFCGAYLWFDSSDGSAKGLHQPRERDRIRKETGRQRENVKCTKRQIEYYIPFSNRKIYEMDLFFGQNYIQKDLKGTRSHLKLWSYSSIWMCLQPHASQRTPGSRCACPGSR